MCRDSAFDVRATTGYLHWTCRLSHRVVQQQQSTSDNRGGGGGEVMVNGCVRATSSTITLSDCVRTPL